jgi:hypothetical protein
MKTLFSILLAAVLSGCTLIDAYFMAKYDTTEHDLVNKISVYSAITKPFCADSNKTKDYAFTLYGYSSELKNFSSHLPRNEMTVKMTDELHIMVTELNNKYATSDKVNKTYCELKLQSISESANDIQKAIAKRPRT